MRWCLVLAALVASGTADAAPPPPEVLTERFVAAWNSHDPKAFEALYTPDAVWVPIAEERTEGRAAIVSEFAKIHTGDGWAGRTTIARKDGAEVHLLKPDVATIFFHMDFIKDGKPVAGFQRALILVAVRDADDWKIAAGQLTKESTPPPQ